jgi:dienelactone hydrolase
MEGGTISARHQLAAVLFVALSATVLCATEPALPGTRPLSMSKPLDVVMVDGINRFCLRELAASFEKRRAAWNVDLSTEDRLETRLAPKRDRFQKIIGAVDPRLTASKESRHEFELLARLDRSSVVARSSNVTVHAVRWRVLDGVTAEGLLLVPKRIRAHVVAIPDADWTPEMFCGMQPDLPPESQLARRLAEQGCLVVVPTLISRNDELSGHPDIGFTNLTHREFIYRQAFEMGRHVIGYEVQKVLAAVDLFEQLSKNSVKSREQERLPIGVCGVAEGGLLALYSAVLDSRIDVTLVSGYFQQREAIWQDPIYRNVWGLLTEFGDAELATLIAPRQLVVEACRGAEVDGPPTVRNGRRNSAAPGKLTTPSLQSVQVEFQRAASYQPQLERDSRLTLAVSGKAGTGPAGCVRAVQSFLAGLGIQKRLRPSEPDDEWWVADSHWALSRQNVTDRQRRQFDEIQVHVQNLMRRCQKTRDARWRVGMIPAEGWLPHRDAMQKTIHSELIGKLPHQRIAPNPRSRQVLKTDRYTGYEIVIDVLPDVIAGGILLLPNDLKPDEKRPVVVCQHGLEATAMDTISREARPYRSYKAFSEELCHRGFIVYAPQNPYRGRDRFRSIQRKANLLKRSLFSFIIAQHQQTLDWLTTLPNVDANRIAFYGLSYGGKTAMRVPPFVDQYCLSICSGDFTDWARVITTNEDRYGYMFTYEYEIPEWNLGHVASYAELAMVMSPRPFMVEQGHRDGGTPTEWVESEYSRVRRPYDLLGVGACTEIELFDGPHTINGKRSFEFLHRHLRWPRKSTQ